MMEILWVTKVWVFLVSQMYFTRVFTGLAKKQKYLTSRP